MMMDDKWTIAVATSANESRPHMAKALLGAGTIRLDAHSTRPLFRQIYDGIRNAILSADLPRGARLPSTRDLADQLTVSRMTVVNAYDQLVAEGYLTSRAGSGTFVSGDLPDEHRLVRFGSDAARQMPSAIEEADIELSAMGLRMVQQFDELSPRIRDESALFWLGVPALDEFPVDVWARLCRHRARELSPRDLAYGEFAGYVPLREAICEYTQALRGVRCQADQVIITAGAQQAIDVAARLLLNPGDRALFEDPGYRRARASIAATGARIIPVAIDANGAAVSLRTGEARLVYVTPSHQFPMGVTMSIERRMELLAWAHKYSATIIEDDYDSLYHYAHHPIPSLQGLDNSQRTIYIGSLSKVLFPALGMGYVIVPPTLVKAFEAALKYVSRPPSRFLQMVVHDFIKLGHFERHIRRMRKVHERRRTALVESISQHLARKLKIIGSSAGLHCAARILTRHKDTKLVQRAEHLGIQVDALSRMSVTANPDHNGLIFGFASGTAREIKARVRKIASVF